MILFALVALSATPAVLACEAPIGTATLCTELRLGKDEDPKPFTDTCDGSKGVVKSHCEKEGFIAKCALGDTTLIYSATSKTSAGESAGVIKGAQGSCSSHGGTFESKIKITQIKPSSKPLPLGELATVASSDCTAEDLIGSKHITCGNSLRPEVTLDFASYTGDDLEPQGPDDVIKNLKELSPSSTFKELGRKTGKTWRVEYSLAPRHGLPAYGFEGVRQFGKKQYLCVGSAWNRGDFEAAKAMCDNLKPAK